MSSTISAPLKQLEKLIVDSISDIEAWFRAQNNITPSPFYSSVDLRNNGHKIAPVDTNLFPGGFNNLPAVNYPLAAEAVRRQIDIVCPNAKSVLLIPENHTRNTAYLGNVVVIVHLLEMAGIHVRLGRVNGDMNAISDGNGRTLPVYAIERDDDRLHCGDFYPCAVLLNNDLSAGTPPILQNLAMPILPPPQLGWSTRKKSGHFYQYERVAEQLATLLGVDPWLFSADFSVCPKVDFNQREGMECLAAAADETLAQIKEKYLQHGITDTPYVVIKANVGTYGMNILGIRNGADVLSLNRKQRNKMAVGKEGVRVSDALIQEGVHTLDSHNGAVAEPVVYMIGGSVVGGFYRVNAQRGSDDNLNSRGMSFSPLPFETACAPPSPGNDAFARLYVYGVVARLANLAAAKEQAAVA